MLMPCDGRTNCLCVRFTFYYHTDGGEGDEDEADDDVISTRLERSLKSITFIKSRVLWPRPPHSSILDYVCAVHESPRDYLCLFKMWIEMKTSAFCAVS